MRKVLCTSRPMAGEKMAACQQVDAGAGNGFREDMTLPGFEPAARPMAANAATID